MAKDASSLVENPTFAIPLENYSPSANLFLIWHDITCPNFEQVF